MFDRKAHNKEYYQRNKDRINVKNQKWREANPKHWAFLMQRQHSKERDIEFLFDFDTWVEWWGEDFASRGDSPEQLVMARYGDEGPYHPDNVYKSTALENALEAGKNSRSKVRETA